MKQSRKWQLTINNPEEHKINHETIKTALTSIKSLVYWCMCDEIGNDKKTPHTHLFVCGKNGIMFSTVKNLFPTAHIEPCKGTSQQNRDYIRKEGKHKDTDKEETNIKETFEEWGEMPVERQGKRNDIDDLYDLIKSGASNFEILEESPQYLLQIEKIEKARQIVKFDKFRDLWRNLEVTYIYGKTRTGKTRGVMEQYGYRNVFRVTDYTHPFDNYQGQDVVVFEEFRSSLKIEQMLNYLDGYPLELPSRYMNKVACYTKVYIITNIPITEQFPKIRKEQFESWLAFKRRINTILHYDGKNVINESKTTMQMMIPVDIVDEELGF